jgi:hypothetical protein
MTYSILVGMLVTRFCRKAGFLGLMGLRGLAFAKERILLRVLSQHLELFPDIAERNLGPPELNCSPFIFVFQAFPCHVFYRSLPETVA